MSFINNFEQTLKDFFFRYHPRKIEKVSQMVSEFKGQEKEVMLLLCKKYKVSPDTIDGLNAYNPTPVVPAVEAIAEETKIEKKAEEVKVTSNEDPAQEEEATEEKK